MWPFRRKKQVDETNQYEEIRKREECAFTNYFIGKQFEYLGINLVVSRHQYYVPPIVAGFFQNSGIYCDYIDKDGVIHSKFFRLLQLESGDILLHSKEIGDEIGPVKGIEILEKIE